MSITTLQEYTRIAKYAKYLPENKRRETWKEQVTRVFDMHREKFKDNSEALSLIEEAESAVHKKEVLGSQRILQFGGTPIFSITHECIIVLLATLTEQDHSKN
jgi:ribonucleoside-triphosphate reductase